MAKAVTEKLSKKQVTTAEECEVSDICTGYTANTPSSSDKVEEWKSAFRYQSPWLEWTKLERQGECVRNI
jgi:hypothetical protein